MEKDKIVVKTHINRASKEKVEEILEGVGISLAGAMRMFLKRVEQEDSRPPAKVRK